MFHCRIHKILPDEFPEEWASDWGEDEYGLRMGFTYKRHRQDFRWCEPGTFVMGSPEEEPGRDNDEAQHDVTLSHGFWLADTSVLQGLWQAVMGKNPSRSKGDERPVENVSWNDAQEFIAKMNDMKPELCLCLPTEAQWEYACRAESDTPFCWGESMDSELVNFDGSYPYNNGPNSENREQTIDVKALPCNDWGLYQMHGNVREWCHDWFGEYRSVSVTDPKGPKSGDGRVLRGGSWDGRGWSCRSAFRNRGNPSGRNVNFGFRLARGHELK